MKNWKLNFAMILLSTTTLTPAHAGKEGEKSGNGGVVFSCNGKLQLVDAWEAQDSNDELNLSQRVTAQMSPLEAMSAMADEYLSRVEFFDASRAAKYRETWDILMSDLMALERDPKFKDTKLIRFTSGELPESLDSDEITRPRGCEKMQAITQKKPILQSDRLLTIDRLLWDRMDLTTRTLILFHEINVTQSIAKGFTKTTEPARILNRFFGSPYLSSTQSVCQYLDLIFQIRMSFSVLWLFGSDEVYVDLTKSKWSCWDSTRRIKTLSKQTDHRGVFKLKFNDLKTEFGVKLPEFEISLNELNFSENASSLVSAKITGSETMAEAALTPGACKRCYFEPSGTLQKTSSGSFVMEALHRKVRSDLAYTFNSNPIELGKAKLEVSARKSGTIRRVKEE